MAPSIVGGGSSSGARNSRHSYLCTLPDPSTICCMTEQPDRDWQLESRMEFNVDGMVETKTNLATGAQGAKR